MNGDMARAGDEGKKKKEKEILHQIREFFKPPEKRTNPAFMYGVPALQGNESTHPS